MEPRHTGSIRMLSTRLRMRDIVHGGISGRHGDRAVERSTPFPGFDEPIGVVFADAPHLEMHPDGIVYRAVAWGFPWIPVGLNADIHPLERDLLFFS